MIQVVAEILLMAEIRHSPVEGTVVYPIIFGVSAPSKRWLFGISAINSMIIFSPMSLGGLGNLFGRRSCEKLLEVGDNKFDRF